MSVGDVNINDFYTKSFTDDNGATQVVLGYQKDLCVDSELSRHFRLANEMREKQSKGRETYQYGEDAEKLWREAGKLQKENPKKWPSISMDVSVPEGLIEFVKQHFPKSPPPPPPPIRVGW